MEAVIAGSSSYILLGLVLLLGYMFKEEHKMCCFSSIANSLSSFTWDCGRLSWFKTFWSEKTDLRFLVLCSNVETLESWNTMVFKALPRTVFYSQRMRMLVVNFMVNPLDCYWHHLLNCIRENRWRFVTGQQCLSGRHFTWASVASEPLQDHKGNQNRLFSSGVFLRSGWYDIIFHTDR